MNSNYMRVYMLYIIIYNSFNIYFTMIRIDIMLKAKDSHLININTEISHNNKHPFNTHIHFNIQYITINYIHQILFE